MGPESAGLAVEARGTVYFAIRDLSLVTAGVYRIGSAKRLPGTKDMLVANGLALGKHRNLTPATPSSAGANMIAFWKDDLIVCQHRQRPSCTHHVDNDGIAGNPEIVAGDTGCGPTDEHYGIDGIAFDVEGHVYALSVSRHKLVRINPRDHTSSVLLPVRREAM